MQEILDAGRYRRREQRLCLKIALHLIVDLVRCCDVLRIHLGHHELSEHLNLLHLRQCDFVADLNRLQITYRRLVLQLKVLQGGLFGLEFWAWACAEASAPLNVPRVVSTVVCGLWTPAVEAALKPG